MKEVTLGQFVKEQRVSRGMSIDKVRYEIGLSTFSRFENDRIDLTSSRLDSTFLALGIDYQDLFKNDLVTVGAFREWRYTDPTNWNAGKVECLIAKLHSLNFEQKNSYISMIELVLNDLIFAHEANRKLKSEVVNRLDKYFSGVDFVSIQDNRLLIAVLPLVDLNQAYVWTSKILQMLSETDMNDIELATRISTVCLVSERALVENDFEICHNLLTKLNNLIENVNLPINAKYNYEYVGKAYDLLVNHTDDSKHNFVELICATEVIFSKQIFETFRNEAIQRGWLVEKDFAMYKHY